MCKKQKIDHMNSESLQENGTHKVLRDFEIQTDHLNSARRPEQEIVKKKRKLKNMEYERDGDSNCNWCTRYRHQMFDTGIGGFGYESISGDHQNYSIVKIGQIPEKSPGDLRRLPATQTPVKNHQLTLV